MPVMWDWGDVSLAAASAHSAPSRGTFTFGSRASRVRKLFGRGTFQRVVGETSRGGDKFSGGLFGLGDMDAVKDVGDYEAHLIGDGLLRELDLDGADVPVHGVGDGKKLRFPDDVEEAQDDPALVGHGSSPWLDSDLRAALALGDADELHQEDYHHDYPSYSPEAMTVLDQHYLAGYPSDDSEVMTAVGAAKPPASQAASKRTRRRKKARGSSNKTSAARMAALRKEVATSCVVMVTGLPTEYGNEQLLEWLDGPYGKEADFASLDITGYGGEKSECLVTAWLEFKDSNSAKKFVNQPKKTRNCGSCTCVLRQTAQLRPALESALVSRWMQFAPLIRNTAGGDMWHIMPLNPRMVKTLEKADRANMGSEKYTTVTVKNLPGSYSNERLMQWLNTFNGANFARLLVDEGRLDECKTVAVVNFNTYDDAEVFTQQLHMRDDSECSACGDYDGACWADWLPQAYQGFGTQVGIADDWSRLMPLSRDGSGKSPDWSPAPKLREASSSFGETMFLK